MDFNKFRETFLRVQGELNAVFIKVEPIFEEEIINEQIQEESVVVETICQPDIPEIKVDYLEPLEDFDVIEDVDSLPEFIQSEEEEEHLEKSPKKKSKKDEQLFACSIPGCDRKFKKEARLDLHVAAHTIKFIAGCKICDKEFRTQEKLDTHMKTCHLSRKEYICSEGKCKGRIFNRKEHYRKHLKSAHNMEDPTYNPMPSLFKCDEIDCTKKYKTEEKLNAHKRKHQGLKGWPCELCPKAFEEEKNLKRHIYELHETDTPRYSCPHQECNGKTFWQSQSLESHLRTIHCPKEPEPYRYFCDVCGKAVKTALSLKVTFEIVLILLERILLLVFSES